MATTAERVVTELIADTSGHDPKIRTSAQVVEGAASQIERAANRAEGAVRQGAESMSRSLVKVSGSSRAGMQQLGFQLNDVVTQLASGTSAATVFAQQSGQVIQSFQLMSGGASRFATFMSGPYGIAMTAGAIVLLPLIARLFDTRTEVEKATDRLAENAHQAEITRQAQEAYAHTLPGVTALIRQETEALTAQNRTLEENQELTNQRANQRLQEQRGNLSTIERQLGDARRTLAEAETALRERRPVVTINGVETLTAAAVQRARQQVQILQRQFLDTFQSVMQAEQETRTAEIPLLDRSVTISLDAEAAATERLRQRLVDLRLERQAGRISQSAYYDERRRIQAAGDAELEQIRRAERESNRVDRSLVRPVTGAVLSPFGSDRSAVPLNGRRIPGRRHAGVDLRGDIGDPVVAPESGTAFVRNAPGGLGLYVEIRADSGARNLLAHLSRANIRSGQRVTAGDLIGAVGQSGNAEGPHLHYQRMVNGRWVDPMRNIGSSGAAQEAQEEARRARELAERRRRDEEQFQQQMAGLSADLLNARRRQVQTEEEAAADDIAAIRAEQAARATRIHNEAVERSHRDPAQAEIAQAEAQILLGLNRQVAEARIEARNALMRQRIEEQRLEIAQRDLRDQQSVLQARGQLARTAMERRDIELRLLALQHQEELLAIQKQRAQKNLSPAQLAQLDRAEAAANERYGLGQQNVMRNTAGPLEAFLNAIPHGAREMDEALQAVAVHGLTALNDGLAQAATRFLHLGGVAGDILNQILSDLIRIGLQQAELAAFGGGNGGGGGGLFGALGRLLGISGPANSGGNWFDVFGPNGLTGHASGYLGPVGGVGGMDRNILSINGQPRARVSGSETLAIIPQGKALGFNGGRAAMGGGFGPPQISVHVDARDAVLTHAVRAWVREGIEEATMRGSAGGASYLTRRAATVRRQTL